MRYDLHMHSTASDGRLSPTEVVSLAHKEGVELMALTDHDTMAGVEEAGKAAGQCGILFVPGAEISTQWAGRSIHVVGLDLDPFNEEIRDFLDGICRLREERGYLMAKRFESFGIMGSLEGALALAQRKASLSRTHFAQWLVDTGRVKNNQEAFEKYLKDGRPCCVDTPWPSVAKAVEMIHRGGGLAVLAHPGRYRFGSDLMLEEFFKAFLQMGGDAIEVTSGSQPEKYNRICADAARRMGFLASSGSDFHSTGGVRPLPGRQAPVPKDIPTILDEVLERIKKYPKVTGAGMGGAASV